MVKTYIAYLDEFGHDGRFEHREHPNFSTSPVFGYAGFIIPAKYVRDFSVSFFKCKERLWPQELKQTKRPPYQWEKKGSSAFKPSKIESPKTEHVRSYMFRLINELTQKYDGHTIMCGFEKYKDNRFDQNKLYEASLRKSIRALNEFCMSKNAKLMVCLDYHTRRKDLLRISGLEMFGKKPCHSLIEPVFQGESELYQTLQFADWIASIAGRISAHEACPNEYSDYGVFKKIFNEKIFLNSKIKVDMTNHEKSGSFAAALK